MDKKGIEADLKSLEKLADLLDSRFILPGTRFGIGVDGLLGLIPGIGDTLTAVISAYIIAKASKYQLPWHIKGRMVINSFFDWLFGLIPFFGDIFDIGFKANKKNVALLREHLERFYL
jgi:hypothetical protein